MSAPKNSGYTTGICAAGAVKACAMFLKNGVVPENVLIKNLDGELFDLRVVKNNNLLGIIKNSGAETHDITNGIFIGAEIFLTGNQGGIKFLKGEGVGVATLEGLKIPVGEPAINPIPRMIIKNNLREIFNDGEEILIKIIIPDGEKIALNTFNPRLGILGGLSILGTTGHVKPNDERALLESLSLELNVIKNNFDSDKIYITFGNISQKFLMQLFNIQSQKIIQAENYIGHVLDEAARLNFNEAIIAGMPGKLLKVAAGNFVTHNKICDSRFEVLCCHLALIGASRELIKRVYECNTVNQAVKIIDDANFNSVWDNLAQAALKKCEVRVKNLMRFRIYFLNDDGGVLGCAKS